MKIIKRTSDNVVVFAGDDLALTAQGASGDDWTTPLFTTANAVLETVAGPLPNGWRGGAWAYNGAWVSLPGEQARIDAQASADLALRRAAKWEQIKAERDRRKALGVKVGAHWYHSDDSSRIQQLSLFVMGSAVPAIQWKTLTLSPPSVFVTMTQAIAAGIFQGTAASDAAIFGAAETHRVAMEASATPESYDISSGWPASIEDAP